MSRRARLRGLTPALALQICLSFCLTCSANALARVDKPYGERDDAHVIARSRLITAHLRARHDIKALVVACNTATAAAIAWLRQQHPDLLIVGVEPALKPATALSKTYT